MSLLVYSRFEESTGIPVPGRDVMSDPGRGCAPRFGNQIQNPRVKRSGSSTGVFTSPKSSRKRPRVRSPAEKTGEFGEVERGPEPGVRKVHTGWTSDSTEIGSGKNRVGEPGRLNLGKAKKVRKRKRNQDLVGGNGVCFSPDFLYSSAPSSGRGGSEKRPFLTTGTRAETIVRPKIEFGNFEISSDSENQPTNFFEDRDSRTPNTFFDDTGVVSGLLVASTKSLVTVGNQNEVCNVSRISPDISSLGSIARQKGVVDYGDSGEEDLLKSSTGSV